MRFSNFVLEDGVYCQSGFSTGEFEKEYFDIRSKEGRVYDDETVKKLPFIEHPEWRIRATSAKKLVGQLRKEKCTSFIEIGCGNGWLTNYIQSHLNITAYGIDVGKHELQQASRVSSGGATFFYGDIFSEAFNDLKADVIILAACIQYFPDPKRLIDILTKKGTVHIIDSPIYKPGTSINARERSKKYFDSKDASAMEQFYFHHEETTLPGAEFLYQPNRLKILLGGSPFPWIRIRKG